MRSSPTAWCLFSASPLLKPDTKLCHKARHPDDIIELQEDIKKLED